MTTNLIEAMLCAVRWDPDDAADGYGCMLSAAPGVE